MKYLRIFLIILLFVSLFNGCINQKKDSGVETYFKSFALKFEELPLLNNPVNLVCTAIERDFASNIVIEVILPEGFELVDGTLTWEGHVDPNQTKTHTVTVKAVKTGQWTISAWAGPDYYPHYDAESLYVTVTETSAHISEEPFQMDSYSSCTNSGSLSYFKDFSIFLSDSPTLSRQTTLVCTAIERDFASNIVIEVILPEGFELVDGTLTWKGHVDPNQTKTHTVTVKAVKTGKWTISAWAGPSQSRFDVEWGWICTNE